MTQKSKNDRICNYCLCEVQNEALIEFFNQTLENKQQALEQLQNRHEFIDQNILNVRQEIALLNEKIQVQENEGLFELEQICKQFEEAQHMQMNERKK